MKQLATCLLFFIALTSCAQYLEMLELEQYQIYDDQLAQNSTTGITHTIEFYKGGTLDGSKNKYYECEID